MGSKKSKKGKKGSGISKEMKASPELQAIVKEKKISRGGTMKALWKYIKKHGLQSSSNGQVIKLDEKMKAVFGKIAKKDRKIKVRGKDLKLKAGRIFMTEMAKPLSKHLEKID